jgi:hypothetical protein
MTPKIKDRWINGFVAAITGGLVAFFTWGLSSSEGRTIRINNKLNDKADVTYVDKQDDAVKKIIYDYKTDHQIQHTNEYLLMKAEVEAVKVNTETIMTFWGIPKATDN